METAKAGPPIFTPWRSLQINAHAIIPRPEPSPNKTIPSLYHETGAISSGAEGNLSVNSDVMALSNWTHQAVDKGSTLRHFQVCIDLRHYGLAEHPWSCSSWLRMAPRVDAHSDGSSRCREKPCLLQRPTRIQGRREGFLVTGASDLRVCNPSPSLLQHFP